MIRPFSMCYHIALAIYLFEVGSSLARFRGTGFFEEFHNGFCCYLGFGSVPLTNNNDASSRSMWRHSTAVSGVACPVHPRRFVPRGSPSYCSADAAISFP